MAEEQVLRRSATRLLLLLALTVCGSGDDRVIERGNAIEAPAEVEVGLLIARRYLSWRELRAGSTRSRSPSRGCSSRIGWC
jgi:hypothetical protein